MGTSSSITITPPTLPYTYRVTASNGTCTAEDYISLYACTDNNLCAARRVAGPNGDEMADSSALMNAVPNPFADHTVINYTLAENVRSAEMQVYDPFGKLLRTYRLSPGSTSVDIDCADLANGIYFAKMIADDKQVGITKLLIAK